MGYHAPTLTMAEDGPRRARAGQDDLDFLFAIVADELPNVVERIVFPFFKKPAYIATHNHDNPRSLSSSPLLHGARLFRRGAVSTTQVAKLHLSRLRIYHGELPRLE